MQAVGGRTPQLCFYISCCICSPAYAVRGRGETQSYNRQTLASLSSVFDFTAPPSQQCKWAAPGCLWFTVHAEKCTICNCKELTLLFIASMHSVQTQSHMVFLSSSSGERRLQRADDYKLSSDLCFWSQLLPDPKEYHKTHSEWSYSTFKFRKNSVLFEKSDRKILNDKQHVSKTLTNYRKTIFFLISVPHITLIPKSDQEKNVDSLCLNSLYSSCLWHPPTFGNKVFQQATKHWLSESEAACEGC